MAETCSSAALKLWGDAKIDSFNLQTEFEKLKKGTCIGPYICEHCGNTIDICNDNDKATIMGITLKGDPINLSISQYEEKFCKTFEFRDDTII